MRYKWALLSWMSRALLCVMNDRSQPTSTDRIQYFVWRVQPMIDTLTVIDLNVQLIRFLVAYENI